MKVICYIYKEAPNIGVINEAGTALGDTNWIDKIKQHQEKEKAKKEKNIKIQIYSGIHHLQLERVKTI